MVIDKNTFWALVEDARSYADGDCNKLYEYIVDQLVANNDPEQAINFYNIVHAYEFLAYKYGLWTAATVMHKGWCSDDGFHYFEGWLIAQGKEIYLAALANPDSLANVEVLDGAQFESMDYIGADAYTALTGNDFYNIIPIDGPGVLKLRQELAQDIQYDQGINEWHVDDAVDYVPALCAKYLQK